MPDIEALTGTDLETFRTLMAGHLLTPRAMLTTWITGNKSIANGGSGTAVVWDAVSCEGMTHAVATNYTVPTGFTKVRAIIAGTFAGHASGTRGLWVTRYRSGSQSVIAVDYPRGGLAVGNTLTAEGLWRECQAGDVILTTAFQSSGGALNLAGNTLDASATTGTALMQLQFR